MTTTPVGLRPGLVLDAGALIELQRWGSPLRKRIEKAIQQDKAVLVPSTVLCEWLVGAKDHNLSVVRDLFDVVEIDEELAREASAGLVGRAHARCEHCRVRGGPSVVDATVMAVANAHGDTVITGDMGDLRVLADHFNQVVLESK